MDNNLEARAQSESNTKELSIKQLSVIRTGELTSRLLLDKYPGIADEIASLYEHGMTQIGIATNLELCKNYGISPSSARMTVIYVIRAMLPNWREIGETHQRDYATQTCKEKLGNQTAEQLREHGIHVALARGNKIWSLEEGKTFQELCQNESYQHTMPCCKGAPNYAKIQKELFRLHGINRSIKALCNWRYDARKKELKAQASCV